MISKTISHYKILEKLGEGGMGVVYKAEDTKLDRLVALKFLPSHLVDDEKALNRLLKEAKSASKINHPNVCTIYAIEEHEDTHFIVMEFVDGMTLRQKINVGAIGKSPLLSIDESVEYSIQICKALKAAHDKGIIHRDIKSENVMINLENMVKVMDFGLAKLKDEAGLTKTGTAGTIAYMAPEQLQGFEIDTRTDIWSFGVVMYEMLTGQLPFKGEYESAMMYSIVNTKPEPISDVPKNLEQIVNKMLAKSTGERYQNVNELIGDLKKTPSQITVSKKQEKSIVVLPFVNMSPEPEQEYFSDGLTEEIITDLSHIHELRVISRTSAMMLKGTKKDMKTISRELDVQYVLEGSVRKAGNNLRITAQLIDATTDAHLWAEKYSGTLDDVFDIQEKVSRSIADELKVKLSSVEKEKIAERPIDNVQAYELYLRARREMYRVTADSIERAIRDLQNSLKIIGKNALLYAGIGLGYCNLYEFGIKVNEETLKKAEEYALKVLRLEPDSVLSYDLLGRIERFRGSGLKAINNFKKALEIEPDDHEALTWLSLGYTWQVGKPSLSEPYIKRLFTIDPLNPMNNLFSGMMYWMQVKLDDALNSFKQLRQLESEGVLADFWIAYILAWQEKYNELYSLIDQMANTETQDKMYKIFTAWLIFLKYALRGEKNRALDVLTDEVKHYFWNDPELPWLGACNFALINEKEEALNWLEHVINKGWINYPLFNENDPLIENIRGEERFKKLMERVKYEWENFEV